MNKKRTYGSRYKEPVEQPGSDRMAAARALYEGIPNSTVQSVAEEVGVAAGTVYRWRKDGNWQKAMKRLPDMSARAAELANKFSGKVMENSKDLTPSKEDQAVAKQVADEFAVDLTSKVLERHRAEWAAPRKIAYEAIKKSQDGDVAGGFEVAKLSKILSETLQLIQAGECRAFGIKPGEQQGNVVVIERTGDGE